MKNPSFKQIVKTVLMIWVLLICIFALLSGAGEYDEGLMGVVKNSPNAFPWALFLIVLWLARKSDLIMGIILVLVGFATILAFKLYESLLVFILIPFPLFAIGAFLLLVWYLDQRKQK